jgi:hypothetical protein
MINNSHVGGFDEGRAHCPGDLEPLTEPDFHPFPYEEIYKILDGEHEMTDEEMKKLAKALKGVLLWAAKPIRTPSVRPVDVKIKLRQIGLRVMAALWVLEPLDPTGFKEGPISGAELSLQLSNNRVAISDAAADFTRIFGIRNRCQCHGRNGKHAIKLKNGVKGQRLASVTSAGGNGVDLRGGEVE